MTDGIYQSANTPQPARTGGEFFAVPAAGPQTRYEALRAYLLDGEPAATVAARFGYTTAGLNSAVADFRAGAKSFFLDSRPGPKTAPGKDAARAGIIALRGQGYSIDEIAAALAAEGIGLNRTGISEVITEAGLPRIWRRPEAARGGPRRNDLPRARALTAGDFLDLPADAPTRMAGLLLALPDLLDLDLPALATAAGYPGTRDIPAISYLLSLLAVKLTGTRRVSHVHDLAADPGAALFAGLTALPKTTALTTYSYRLQHSKQKKFLTALDKASLAAGLATGEVLNLDFHAVMHWGEDPALEKHYVPSRSQRTRSVLTFFAEDADSHALLYANADLAKTTQNKEVLAFADHWKTVTGTNPALLVMDSKVTTQTQLGELTERGIGFITLRARTPRLTAHLHALPASAWTNLTVARAGGRTRRVRVIEDPAAKLSTYPGTLRQLAVAGLGHDEPTILITNQHTLPAKQVIETYSRRMNIEQRLAEAIRSFHLDSLAGAVPLNIDLDVVLTVLAHTVCAALRRRIPGYATATPDTLQRRFLSTGGHILNHSNQIVVRLDRRTYSPVLRHADLPDVAVPWLGGRTVRYEFA
ncbi:MAG: transposase [Pseudonocardiaceae bacterium]